MGSLNGFLEAQMSERNQKLIKISQIWILFLYIIWVQGSAPVKF